MTTTSKAPHPLPSLDGLTGQFHSLLAQGELRLQRCNTCHKYRHIPRYLCPACHSDEWEWAPCEGIGEIYSFTTTMRAMHPAFTDTPFTIATVAMQEGPRLLGRLNGVVPQDVKIGMRVMAVCVTVGANVGLVEFQPLHAA